MKNEILKGIQSKMTRELKGSMTQLENSEENPMMG